MNYAEQVVACTPSKFPKKTMNRHLNVIKSYSKIKDVKITSFIKSFIDFNTFTTDFEHVVTHRQINYFITKS